MKHLLKIIILLCLTASFSYAQDCRSLRVGKFRLDDPETKLRSLIERTETTQIETNLDTGETVTGSIKWVDDCTYVFTYLESSSKNETVRSFIGEELVVEITKIEGEKISFNCSIKEYNYEASFFMKRIE